MYETHDMFEAPADRTTPLWRYMTLAKLLSLLQERSLWLSRADLLGDPHEGSVGPRGLQDRNERLRRFGAETGHPEELTETMIESMSIVTHRYTRHHYVNCWHMSQYESAAMWQIYGGAGAPVAIRSTFDRLCESLLGEHRSLVGKVQYVDPQTQHAPFGNTFAPYVCKRLAFAYEQEVRVVQDRIPAHGGVGIPGVDGVSEPVDLDRLIVEIVVGPDQPEWYFMAVEKVVAVLTPSITVKRSDLDTAPVW